MRVPATKSHILPEVRASRRVRSGVPAVRAPRRVSSKRCAPTIRTTSAARFRLSARPTPRSSSSASRPACTARMRAGVRSPATTQESCCTRRFTPTASRRNPSRCRGTTASSSIGCRITNAVKCLPPDNKPTPAEARECNRYLAADLAALPAGGAILALGRIAHDATLRALGHKGSGFPFAHGACAPPSAERRALRQLSLQSLQHQHPTVDGGDVPCGVRRDRRSFAQAAGRSPCLRFLASPA